MFSDPVSNYTKVPDLQVINSSTHLILTEKKIAPTSSTLKLRIKHNQFSKFNAHVLVQIQVVSAPLLSARN